MELCGTTINFYVWGTHLPKIDKHGKKCIVFYILRIYAGKNRKTKNVGTWGPGAPTFLRFSFFEIFFSKFVKCKKLAHFWHGLLFWRVNEWLGQWWLLLIFIPYSLTLSLTLSSALSKLFYEYTLVNKTEISASKKCCSGWDRSRVNLSTNLVY